MQRKRGGEAKETKEIKAEFQINGRQYILFIEKKFWHYKVYLFQKLEGRKIEPVPVETVSVSTIAEALEYWRIFLTLHLRQKMKKTRVSIEELLAEGERG